MRYAIILLITFASFARADSKPSTDMPLLTVTGEGETTEKPDRAILRLGAVAQADQAVNAQAQVNGTVKDAIEAIKKAGIEESAITTTGLTLEPVYSQPDPRADNPVEPKIVAYRASNIVEIRLTDLDKVGPAIDAGVQAGANRIDSLIFDLKDDSGARAKAIQQAVAKARAKAEVLAKAAGVTLVYLHDLEETDGNVRPISMGTHLLMAGKAATPVQPGQIHVTAGVTLRYAILAK